MLSNCKNNEALRFPIAFQRLAHASSDNVFPPILLHRRGRLLFVFFVTDRIGNFDFDNDVGWHQLSCRQSFAPRNHNSRNDGRCQANGGAEPQRKGCSKQICDCSGFDAAHWNHHAEDK